MACYAIIPARGGSKEVLKKNIITNVGDLSNDIKSLIYESEKKLGKALEEYSQIIMNFSASDYLKSAKIKYRLFVN